MQQGRLRSGVMLRHEPDSVQVNPRLGDAALLFRVLDAENGRGNDPYLRRGELRIHHDRRSVRCRFRPRRSR
jgi:hypothetical protein